DWIAWHLDHPALLLPLWRQKERVAGDHPVRAIVLTREAPARNAADGEKEWVRASSGTMPIRGFSEPIPVGEGAWIYLSK
ncbi:MAG TPA: hypothetical protein VFP58_09230, partial [Candidatus Eisenbacteria bacterium]|nr:hypothetical protein [Candidatus Eisenbacteria bacterium]